MESQRIGQVSLDTGEIALIDGMYVLGDEDHDAGRTAAEVALGYDGVVAEVQSDGVFGVYLDVENGRPVRVRIEIAEAIPPQ